VGWPEKCRGDTEFVSVNNVVLRNLSCTSCCGVRAYSAEVVVRSSALGGQLIMTFGNRLGYTILSYLMVEGKSTTLPLVPNLTKTWQFAEDPLHMRASDAERVVPLICIVVAIVLAFFASL